eukprot:SAG25_NODE_2652_length_1469_cov_1.577372_3_plen_42_part_01
MGIWAAILGPLTLPRVAGGMFWVVGPETTYRLLHAGEYHQLE